MTSSLSLSLDTLPPANPVLLLDSGVTTTGNRVVVVTITSDSQDVTEMLVWGDVDPAENSHIQPTEGGSAWTVYVPSFAVRLSAAGGRKSLYARLRDDVGNYTLVFFDFIDYDVATPVVSMQPPDRTRISQEVMWDTSTFVWSASIDTVAYMVKVVPHSGSPMSTGVLVGTAHGSVNTSGRGPLAAGATVTTSVTGSDLRAASPGNGSKVCKVFVQAPGGVWSV